MPAAMSACICRGAHVVRGARDGYDGGMKSFGRSLQLLGLVLLPLSMLLEVTGGLGRSFGLSDMVLMLVFGTAAFGLGRLVEGYAHR